MSQERKKSNRKPADQPLPDAIAPQSPSRVRTASAKAPARPRTAKAAAEPVTPEAKGGRAKSAAAKPAPVRKPRKAAARKPAAVTPAEVAGPVEAVAPEPVGETIPVATPASVPAAVIDGLHAVLAGAECAPTIAGAPIADPAPAQVELSESELRDRIARRATEIWLSHGGMGQGPIEDWLQAEAEVRRTLEVVASV